MDMTDFPSFYMEKRLTTKSMKIIIYALQNKLSLHNMLVEPKSAQLYIRQVLSYVLEYGPSGEQMYVLDHLA